MGHDKDAMMTIGHAADAAGIAATTLRYYERQGILEPDGRTGKGYRLYAAESLQRLAFIRSARSVGFTLDDIRELLRLDGEKSCRAVRTMIERRLADVDHRLSELERVRSTLSSARRRCRASRQACAVLSDLKRRRTRGS